MENSINFFFFFFKPPLRLKTKFFLFKIFFLKNFFFDKNFLLTKNLFKQKLIQLDARKLWKKVQKGAESAPNIKKSKLMDFFNNFRAVLVMNVSHYLTILRSDDNFPRDICPCNICQGTNFFNQKFFLD